MITIEGARLARAMKNAAAVTESRNTIPILGNVLLRADGDVLEIVTTDLDVEYRERLPLAQGGSLATTVDARRFSAMVGLAGKDAQISIAASDNRLTVKTGRSRWQLPMLPAQDFPLIPFGEPSASLAIAGPHLSEAMAKILWAASTNEARHYLQGPLLHDEGGKSALVATDGYALMRVVTGVDHPGDAPEVILGPKWSRVVEAASRDAATVELAWDRAKIRAVIGPVTITGNLIDGQFPQYRGAIPKPDEDAITVDPAALRDAARHVQVLANEKTRIVKLERNDGSLRLSCVSTDGADADAEVPADSAAGFVAGFDGRYVEQVLAAIGGDSVVIHQANGNSSVRIERAVPDGVLGVIQRVSI